MRVTVNEVSSHLCKMLTQSKHICRQDGDATTSHQRPVVTCYNSAKPPETYKSVRKRPKRIRFPRDAQVKMAFVIEIMSILQLEHLYSSPLTCFR